MALTADTVNRFIMTDPTSHTAAAPPAASAFTDRLPYPGDIFRRLLRLPIWLYRLGLGPLLAGAHLMVLTTTGRASGLPRHTAIEYRTHGSKTYVISAWGERPQWYKNLLAQPLVGVAQGGQRFGARARVVYDPGEATRVLYLFRKRAPAVYDALLARLSSEETVSARTVPAITDHFVIVRLDPTADKGGPAPVEADWRKAWTALAAGCAGLVLAAALRRLLKQMLS